MPIINRIADFHDEMTAWRRTLHMHPETAFEEFHTSDFVAAKLAEFGYEVHRGLAGTGVVGTLRGAKPDNGRAIGLRADMDALNMEELNTFEHRSQQEGKMHACGHDGHTTMLLGAGRYLSETRNFAGTIHLIFQPAEEGAGGGRRMVEDGLFDKFPVDAVFGMHNMPGIPVGSFGTRTGAILTAMDLFEIRVNGIGTHAATPELGIDPIVVSSQIVLGLQTIISRELNPLMSVVLTITEFKAGTGALNTVPDHALLRGTARILNPEVRDSIRERLRRIVEGIAQAHRARVDIKYWHNYPPLVTDSEHTKFVIGVAREIAGAGRVDPNYPPNMASEDFSFMLQAKPGAYVFIGNGPEEGGRILHNPLYDFNDEILPIGASYWARLVESSMSA
ncbi:MAG TPA: M20 aminoacylase family protein [Steroidobacteraceae bacterium]|jgi:amidohydrolase|nr:M20 aminoacylase family protein [Steroidobacteraceae bacterium]